MPNLIFKKKNSEGKTIEKIDQIYFLNLESNNTVEMKGFDFFYFSDYYKKPKEEKIIHDGERLKLEDDNLYFIEIKKSMDGLYKS